MLKALEVHGFKSFAEKTRFDFPEGITVVVGPNGSGKSNVVDAIKWVLGAQSAKALRGKDMADVIFKGSSAGRKPANTAEASIIFDNTRKLLAHDSDEIRVTRRVYRSGEGEYLINGEACRLRDIKDLFRGTGVGTDAYSLIEQGKVGAMLQSSGKERRSMFEEAAGISRFKAKKVETERRLARVDQNLIRLSDIVDEVERRLKSVKSQASKAQRYRQLSNRLQELRTQVGLVDWRDLTAKEAELAAQSSELTEQIAQSKSNTEGLSSQLENVETQIAELEYASRDAEQQRSAFRERIAGAETALTHHRRRQEELSSDALAHGRRLQAALRRLDESEVSVHKLDTELKLAEADRDKHQEALTKCETRLANLKTQLEEATHNLAEAQATGKQAQEQHDELTVSIRKTEAQAASAAEAAANRCIRLEEIRQKQQLHAEASQLNLESFELAKQRLEQIANQLPSAQERCEAARGELSRLRKQLSEKETQRVRLAERENVLADLERRREGVNSAAKELLARSRQTSAGVYADVAGLVADLIEVNVEAAYVIEAALGDHAQFVVISSQRLVDHLQKQGESLPGRVGLIALESSDQNSLSFAQHEEFSDLEEMPGVIGRADRFVQTPERYANVIQRCLGQTWVVEDNLAAQRIREAHHNTKPRLVTLEGTVWEPDGTVMVGPPSAATGLIARRSELRSLRDELTRLDATIPHIAEKTQAVEDRIAVAESERSEVEAQKDAASAEAAQQQSLVESDQRTTSWLEEQSSEIQAELDQTVEQQQAASKLLSEAQSEILRCQRELENAQQQAVDLGEQREQIASQRTAAELQINTAQLETARCQQQTEALATHRQQLQQSLDERRGEADESRRRVESLQGQTIEETLATLRQTSLLATWYLESENQWRQTRDARLQRQRLTQQRAESAQALRKGQQALHGLEQKLHQAQVSLNDSVHQREHLAERMRDDYGIDLATQDPQEQLEELTNREEVEAEITDLRRKINNIGAVNMDALSELDELDQRFSTLSAQYEDLSEAKASLERIIQRINSDSRRLFSETLEAIRVNFQTLYRKLFGGGHADLIMEEGVDLLDSGIEIVANPPGKPAFSNSLLSGGEQGLTAVALLMAIFQHRPSPFCILDEVDAPLDESNIGRFVGVLREFLDTTKFVVVTHSKKTMTAANTLYGVTMQEPNVSKRVSVQFEDVSEDGEISAAAIAREAESISGGDDDERGAA